MSIAKNENRCQHYYADGRQCRMLKMEGHPYLCPHHWQQQEQIARSCAASLEMVPLHNKLHTASGVREALSNLFRLVAQDRISARQGALLAYIGQLLITSMPQIRKDEEELIFTYQAFANVFTRKKSAKCGDFDKMRATLSRQRLVEMGLLDNPVDAPVEDPERRRGAADPVEDPERSPRPEKPAKPVAGQAASEASTEVSAPPITDETALLA